MAKTANSVNSRRMRVRVQVTTDMIAAFPSLFPTLATAEFLTIDAVMKNITGGGGTRAVTEEFVTGDSEGIVDVDPHVSRGENVIEVLYENGKGEYGTDDVDLYTLLYNLFYASTPLSLPVDYSIAGGAVGDELLSSDTDETFLTALNEPVGGVDATGRTRWSFSIRTPRWTPSVIT